MSFLFRAFQLSFGLCQEKFEYAQRVERTLLDIWNDLREQYFPNHPHLNDYKIIWSERKHRRTLASCNVERKRISVAPVMKLPEANQYLEALIYHEMCHAVLGMPERVNGRRRIHGRDFKNLEMLHHGIPHLDRWIANGGWIAAARKYNRAMTRKRNAENAMLRRSRVNG